MYRMHETWIPTDGVYRVDSKAVASYKMLLTMWGARADSVYRFSRALKNGYGVCVASVMVTFSIDQLLVVLISGDDIGLF